MNLLPRPRRVVERPGRIGDREPSERIDPSLPAQGYRLTIDEGGVGLLAADEAGAAYGRATLAQLRAAHPGELPLVEIEDHPDIAVRGVMVDVSRDKVPTLDTLRALVDRLASWKVNHLELYTEHTFAAAGHEEVWADAGPYTCEELRELDAYCRTRHVELSANRNCLGHMERFLRHDRYRSLAIAPDGFTDPFGRRRRPMTLDPANPGSLDLVRDLLEQLVPCFTSGRVHVGLDEPFELPRDRIPEYGAYLERLRSLDCLRGRELLIWGDVVLAHPELLEGVRETVCIWGYESWHPFAAQAAQVRDAGLSFWTCPGTSSWLSLVGRWTNARENLLAATGHGAAGYLVTDWGDLGHLQYPPASDPGFAYGAAVAWCVESNRDLDVASALDVHRFQDATGELSRALLRLADAYTLVDPQLPNISTICLPLYFPRAVLGRDVATALEPAMFERVGAELAGAAEGLARAEPACADGALVVDEVLTSAELLAVLCRDAAARLTADGTIASVPRAVRDGLARDLQPIIDRHRTLWLERNRPGGLKESVRRLERILEGYRS